MLPYFPKQFSNKAIASYFISLAIISVMYMSHAMKFQFMLIGAVAVSGFFYFANSVSKKMMQNMSSKRYAKEIFLIAFGLRAAWVLFSYFFYKINTGMPFEFSAADSIMYHDEASYCAAVGWSISHLKEYFIYLEPSDRGYLYYLSTLYAIFGNSIILARIVKSLLGAWTCVLAYKVASRTFGEVTGRLTGVFCAFMPNLIFYCGMHLKETEMIFLIVAFLERADHLIRTKNYTLWTIIAPIILVVPMFFFRTVLGASAVLSFMIAVLLSSSKVVGTLKKVLIGIWAVLAFGYFIGGNVQNEVTGVWNERSNNQVQRRNAQVNRGVNWAKYATGTTMAPLIFVLPLPTMVDVDQQYNQHMSHGGNYVKNILAIFILLALFYSIFVNKNWRDFILPGAFMLCYLCVILSSAFASAERFHVPSFPCQLMFAAYGVTLVNKKNIKFVNLWFYIVPVISIAWAFFKLGSRGLF